MRLLCVWECVCQCVCYLYFSKASGFRKAIQFSDLDLSLKGTWVLSSKTQQQQQHKVNSGFGNCQTNSFIPTFLWLFKISDVSPLVSCGAHAHKENKTSAGWSHSCAKIRAHIAKSEKHEQRLIPAVLWKHWFKNEAGTRSRLKSLNKNKKWTEGCIQY